MEAIDFLISPPTKLRYQCVVCWCVYFCFSAGNLEVCLAWHTLFPAENLISCQSKVGEMWKNPITSCKLYVTALPGTKKKKKNPVLPSYSLGRAFLACDAVQKCKACCDLSLRITVAIYLHGVIEIRSKKRAQEKGKNAASLQESQG